ncbi:hypothetical protein MASR2M69_17370 [Bacteroidota bacterium]
MRFGWATDTVTEEIKNSVITSKMNFLNLIIKVAGLYVTENKDIKIVYLCFDERA